MKHTIRTYAWIAGVLALLVLGCVPVAGVDDNYGADNYMGPTHYLSEPAYINGGFNTYSLGKPIYSSSSLTVIPEWVTAPSRRSNSDAGNFAYRASEVNRGGEPYLP